MVHVGCMMNIDEYLEFLVRKNQVFNYSRMFMDFLGMRSFSHWFETNGTKWQKFSQVV